MFAVIATGGKQYKVSKGDKIKIEKLPDLQGGEKLEFDQVLLVKSDDRVLTGSPVLEGAKVAGKVLGEGKARKVLVFKKKRRKGYKTTRGHRQRFVEVLIEDINAPSGESESEGK